MVPPAPLGFETTHFGCPLETKPFWFRKSRALALQAYMSPELTRMQRYGIKTEVWSLGATLYEMRPGEQSTGGRIV